MTWYRVGPAGIPGSLKTDMDAVLNKKFGTSTTYAPNTWPDNVNLLGPLPEKTASGAIAHIEDGADGVPLKNWLVTLPASLTGYSSVTAYQAKKNLLPNEKYQATANRVNIGQTDDGFSVFLRKGTYTLSVSSSINIRAYYRGELDGSNTLIWSTYSVSGSGTFTLTEDKDVRMWVIGQDGSVSTSDILTIQLEIGSTATSYEAYSAPTTYTASLGRTIYGGTADIITGEGSDNCTRIQIKNRTWEIVTVGSSFQVFACNIITDKVANFNFQVEGYENAETYRNYLQDKQCGTYNITNAMDRIVIRDDSYTTVEDFITAKGDNYIVYENTSPTDFTFTPIQAETEHGVNNFWADEGDSDVTYRADIDLALNA